VLGGQSSSPRLGQTLSVTRILSPKSMDRSAALLVLVHEVFLGPKIMSSPPAPLLTVTMLPSSPMASAVANLSLARLNALEGVSLKGPSLRTTILAASTAACQSASDAPRYIPLRTSSIWLSRLLSFTRLATLSDINQGDVRPRIQSTACRWTLPGTRSERRERRRAGRRCDLVLIYPKASRRSGGA
jgi:hypothetical protein